MRDIHFEIGGRPFFAKTAGKEGAPLILCLHGFPEYSGAYEEVLPLLAEDYFVVAPDQRGFGQSWRPLDVASYKTGKLAGDAAVMVDHFGGGRAAAVVGHDWGAAVAYALAMSHWVQIDALVVANGVHPAPFQRAMAAGGAQTEASQYIDDLRIEGKERDLIKDDHAAIFEIFNKDMDMSWMTPERRAAYRKAWGDENGVRAMLNWYRASPLKLAKPSQPIPPEDLPALPSDALRVAMPHLLIWGMNDSALLPESYDGLDAFCDDLTIEEVAGADHWILHQQPADVASRILRFLARA
ncbi:Soluble epoxide hydrolase [Shimia sp. SK013]|uniref:alpha/beta fold hydrolase n=1 Tax=Shimia sp. SK013 TaxID=1389006 RepID=UPI0006B68D9A|nr:alpha/beta hydrolase [Shimia sp. SK013]KPA21779.1 Soluble epoxide hydrolase [Shimia sp. SK013]